MSSQYTKRGDWLRSDHAQGRHIGWAVSGCPGCEQRAEMETTGDDDE